MTHRLKLLTSPPLTESDYSRILEMAWEDRTPFEAIKIEFGLTEGQTVQVMRCLLKPSAFKRWRGRVSGRKTKHASLRGFVVSRAYCPTQYRP